MFGENDFAARFPSAIAAALSFPYCCWRGDDESKTNGSVGGRRSCFTLCLQTFMHAKAAVADMWLVLFVTAAGWAGYELLFADERSKRPTSNVQRSTFKWWWIFYVALAFAFLAKGPIGWTPLLTVFVVKLFVRDVDLNKRFAFVPGILLMLAIVSAWGIPALMRTHGDFFRIGIGHHVIERSFSTMEGHGAKSLGIYLLTLPFYFVDRLRQLFPMVDQAAVADTATRRGPRRDRQLSDRGSTRHFPHLHFRENEVAALHAAGISSHRSASCATLVARGESAALVQNNCGDDGGRLAGGCTGAFPCGGRIVPVTFSSSRNRSAICSRKWILAPSAITNRVWSGISAGGFRDFSILRSSRMKSRRLHEQSRPAFCDSADRGRRRNLSKRSADRGRRFHNQWFQHRERKTRRSHANFETRKCRARSLNCATR